MDDAYTELPLAIGEGRSRSAFASDAHVTNLMVTPNPRGSPKEFTITHTPSLVRPIADSGTGQLRGMVSHGNYLWWVRGSSLYRWDFGDSAPVVVGSTISDTSSNPVRMVGAGPNQIVIVDPFGANYFVATPFAITVCTPPAGPFNDVCHLDGFTVFARAGTQEFYVSALDNPAVIDPLDFSTADAVSDNIVAVIADHRQLIIGCDRHTEFWYNAGTLFPFVRSQPGVEDVGVFGAGSLAKYNNATFFFGNDRRVYRLEGYKATPVSTEWIERRFPTYLVPVFVRASIFVEDSRPMYLLSLGAPYADTPAFVYDITYNLWHERDHTRQQLKKFVDVVTHTASATTDSVNNGGVFVIAGVNAVGGDKLLEVDGDVFRDDASIGDTIRTITLPAFELNGVRVFCAEIWLHMQRIAGDFSSGLARYDYSDDGGITYKSHGQNTVGAGNEATQSTDKPRIRWHRCGSFFRRIHRFVIRANGAVAITAIRGRFEVGQ